MKNLWLYLSLFLLIAIRGHAQNGVDVIFWLDNSASISGNETNPSSEFGQMTITVRSLIEDILACNSANRVSVVHYGAGTTGGVGKIHIESDFTNNLVAANSFGRQFSSLDYAHESLALIGNALDGIPNAQIVSTQKTLNQAGNALVLVLFTDGFRTSGQGSYLVNYFSTGVGTNAAFANYTSFKTARGATFAVVAKTPNLAAKNAGAAIASVGGSYTGTFESYPFLPGGPNTTPRFYVNPSTFLLSPTQVFNMSQEICAINYNPCPTTVTLISPTHNVGPGITDDERAESAVTASNAISNGSIARYHAEGSVVLTSGFHAANGSRFRGYIADCDAGFVGRLSANTDMDNEIDDNQKSRIALYPNPANSEITVSSNGETLKNVAITSVDGMVVIEAKTGNTSSYQIDISALKKGIYIVTTQTESGNMTRQKLIKN